MSDWPVHGTITSVQACYESAQNRIPSVFEPFASLQGVVYQAFTCNQCIAIDVGGACLCVKLQ